MKYHLVNFVVFQAGWFSCVLGAANGMPWLGLIAVAVAVTLHLKMAANTQGEIQLIILAVTAGLIFDSLLMNSGWLLYPNGVLIPGIAPYWILAMWGLFATTLNVSMSWIKANIAVAALMGAIFGPLSYIAGQRLGGLQFIDTTASIVALAVIWMIAMPLLVVAARRFESAPRLQQVLPVQGSAKGRTP
jgi:hypothetical protein